MTFPLKILKSGVINKGNIASFDIETYQIEKETHTEQYFYMGSVYMPNINNGYKWGENKDCAVFYDQDEMCLFLINNKKLDNTTIWATFLDFDFNMLYKGTSYYHDFLKTPMDGKIIIAQLRKNKNKRKFLDTLNFSPAGVESLGKMLGCPKLPKPKCFTRKPINSKEKKELELYNIRDSEITYKFALYLQKFCNHYQCKLKNTIASTGLDNWRRNAQPFSIFQERKDWLLKHFEGSYKGGRTEVFKRGLIYDINSYDYNSAYPWACTNGVDGLGNYPNPSSAHYTKELTIDHIKECDGISKVTVRCPDLYIPLLGHKTDKLIFPKGEFTGWHTNIELRKAIKLGYEILSLEEGIFYTTKFKPFKDIVTKLYNDRLKYKEEKNVIMEQLVKLMMNSGTYGKFGQRPYGFESIKDVEDVTFTKDGNCFVEDSKNNIIELKDYILRNDLIFYKEDEENTRIPKFSLPILASYTSAITRIKLFEDLHKYRKWVCYTDTDCIKLIDGKKIYSGNKLGELKFEYNAEESVIMKPKMYYQRVKDSNAIDKYKEILKLKGVNQKYFSLDDFKEQMKLNPSSIISKNINFTKLKKSAISCVPYGSILEEKPKNNTVEDTKRFWQSRFRWDRMQDSEPIDVKS